MAKNEFEVPTLTGKIETPSVKPGATSHIKSHPASSKHLETLGFPGELVPNWEKVALEKLEELVSKNKALKVYLDTCVRCGNCTDRCQFFLGTGDPKNMPTARAELLRAVYRKNFCLAGKLIEPLIHSKAMSKEVIEDWNTYFWQCSECRRCAVFCPFGIDTAEITAAARQVLNAIGIGQKYNLEILGKVTELGNNLGIPKNALQNSLEVLEEEMEEDFDVSVKFPLDQKNVDVLMIVPSADLFSSPHVESLIGYAKVFHQAGVSWTLSSYASEFANFGLFYGDYNLMKKVAQRIVDAARELNVKRIIVGECGHAWRVAYSYWDTLVGPFDFLDPQYKNPTHIVEYTLELMDKGALKIDKSANDEFTVTMHDSCNVARASRMGDLPGGQFDLPRELIKRVCNNFVEMDPETIREKTFCCGGGGGLLTGEIMELRVKGASPRVNALKKTMDNNGVNYMAMICAICKAQFTTVLPQYDIPMDTVGGILQLVSNAIVLK